MNNKLFARIMTAVICICMMSTVVFAADPTLTVDGDVATLSFLVGTEGADISLSDEDQITMMAYLVDAAATEVPAYTNQKIVAINQVDGAEGFGDVLIAASKLETGKKVAVVLGGSDGTTESFFAAEETPAPVVTTYTVAYELNGGALADGAANPATFTNETAAAVLAALVAPAKADLVVDTETETTTTVYTFAGWYLDSAFTTAATAENVALSATTAITLYAKYDAATNTVAKPVTPAYTSTLQNVTYNSIEGTVVRIAGLDTTKVVTVDGVTAKYYTKTDGTTVHVACVPRNAAPAVSVADGTPELIKFGNTDGKGEVVLADLTQMGRCITGYERLKPTYLKYSLPTDLMELLVYDVDASGTIVTADITALGRAITGYERQKPTYLKYTLETMTCYTK